MRSDSLDADGRDHGSSVAYRHADFALRHLYGLPPAAMRYISARQGSEVIRLQAVYSAVAMGGSIAVMTVSLASSISTCIRGLLGDGAGGPPGAGAAAKSGCLILEHFANMLPLVIAEHLFSVKQRR